MSESESNVMWEADWIKLQDEKKREREAERIAKQREDEAARVRRKEESIIKDKLEYTDELAAEICERVSAGELLINICNDSHMPTIRRCNRWLKDNIDFSALFKDAISDRLSIFEEEVIQIADDAAKDLKEIQRNGKVTKQVDSDVIARAKLRVDVRFRHLKAGRPSKWGDTSTLITKSEEDFDPTTMTSEELERTIAEIEAKDKVVKSV